MEKIPFFIIGSGRSGSTYLYHLLKVHSKIALTNEARVLDALCFSNAYCNLSGGELSPTGKFRGVVADYAVPLLAKLFKIHAKEILKEFYLNHFPNKNFIRWGDKLPEVTCCIQSQNIFSKVYYLVIIRDPRDVMCSYRSHNKRLEKKFPEISQVSLNELCQVWCRIYKYILSNLLPEQYYLIRYEHFVKSPIKTVTEIVNFLDLEMESDVIESIQTNDTFRSHGTSPSILESIGRWQKELTNSELEIIEQQCSSLMKKFDYK